MTSDIAATMASARQTVLGVVTARMYDDINAATYMIDSFVKEMTDNGQTSDDAWAQMFAASVLLIIPLVECRSAHHKISLDDSLREIGVVLAEFRDQHG
jgi:hypothetical protein